MKPRISATFSLLLAAMLAASPNAMAKKGKDIPAFALGDAGKQLEEKYAAQYATLKAELEAVLPKVDEGRKAAYSKALEAEAAAIKALGEVEARQSAVGRGQGLVAHAKGKWIKDAEKGLAQAKTELKNAKTADAKESAEASIAKWEQNLAEGQAALKERQAILDAALRDQPTIERDMKRAKADLERAKETTLDAMKNMGLTDLLNSDKLDGKLAKLHVFKHATPNRLAAYAEQGPAQQKLLDELLANEPMLIEMAAADGATNGNYGQAYEIYTQIATKVNKPLSGIMHRLALAVALEHATPVNQRNAVAASNAPATVDPVKRFLHYASAYTTGELDPAFDQLRTWDLRMVVDGEEPDEIIEWGREMLRNYRPDHITTKDYRWRYVALVRSDIRYGSQDNQYDEDELQFFQNILKNGGICGRRAFMGRFILRAFGVPTIARPQPGHAALGHWTPDGWVICLGGGWGAGSTKGRYRSDLDFLAATQARSTGPHYLRVKRAQWIGDVAGEQPVYGLIGNKQQPGFWYGVSLYTQKDLIASSKAKTLAAVGEDIGEANETNEEVEINEVTMSKEDLEASVGADGVITIPASATSDPTKSTGKVIFMNSVLGGKQLHYSRTGKPMPFKYKFRAPREGSYTLTARICTPSWRQNLHASINGSDAVTIPLQNTVGMWELTKPITVELKRGHNSLDFSHSTDGQEKGFTIKEFILTPVKG